MTLQQTPLNPQVLLSFESGSLVMSIWEILSRHNCLQREEIKDETWSSLMQMVPQNTAG